MIKEDRLAHEKIVLKNGITVFYVPMKIDIGQAIINIPFGHRHNIGDIPLGGFHFLEHCVLNRSTLFPELDAFDYFIKANGGRKNGTTNSKDTYYEIETHSKIFTKSFEGLLSNVYEPIFKQEDIDKEKTIIQNERKRKSPYYPATNKMGREILDQLFELNINSVESNLGSDESLFSMDVSIMEKLHSYYFTNNTSVFLGGNIDLKKCISLLEETQTVSISLPKTSESIALKQKVYTEKDFEEISRHLYNFGFLIKSPYTFDFFRTQYLLFSFLINNLNGPLLVWLRKEKNWVYEVNKFSRFTDNSHFLGLEIPLSEKSTVSIVRNETNERILDGLSNQKIIEDFLLSIEMSKIFSYQTLDSKVSSLHSTYKDFGHVVTDTTNATLFEKIQQPKYFLDFYLKMKNESEFGEFLFNPLVV